MLDFDSEDIDGMDDDAGDEQEPPPTGRWTATSSYDIYMVDTPKETNGDESMEDNPSKKKAKHGRRPRRSKPRQGNTGTGDEDNSDGADDEYNPEQPAFEQAEQEDGHDSPDEQATDGYPKEDNYMPSLKTRLASATTSSAYPNTPQSRSALSAGLLPLREA